MESALLALLYYQSILFTAFRYQELVTRLLNQFLGILLRIAWTSWTSTQTILGLLESTVLVGWLDNHIIILHHHELEKLVPASQHLLSLLYTVVVEKLHSSLWVLGIKLLSLLLNTCLSSEIAAVQAITNLLQGWEQQTVTRINHVAGHVANPVSVLLAEMHRINTMSVVSLRTLGL